MEDIKQKLIELSEEDYKKFNSKLCPDTKRKILGIRIPDLRNFAKWADENGFESGKNLSIERKDVNGNYCPENCIWIDRKYQSRNRRNTIRLVIDGIEKPLSEWSEIYGLNYKSVVGRYYRGVRNPDDLFYKGNLQMRDLGRE